MKSFGRSIPPVSCRALEILSACVAVLALSAVAGGQTPSPDQVEGMRKLDFLVGEWKGEGWQLNPDGSRHNSFTQKTKAQPKDGDSALKIKDARTYKPQISSGKNTIFTPGTPVFHSSTLDATVYYDDKLKSYRWRGETAHARKHPLEARLVGDRTLQYGPLYAATAQPSDGDRRTTIEVTQGGEWHETLEVWHAGRWHRVEESVLNRVK